MADNTETQTDDAGEQWEATLVNGNTYTFGGTKYERGVTVPVDAATKEALSKRAVDNRTVTDEFEEDGTAVTEARAKFKFNKVGETTAAPRARPRPTR